jgi:hypothetical protein
MPPNTILAPEIDYLYTALSSINDAGQGLFTAIKIYKDEIISVYTGELLSNKESIKRAERQENQYFITLLSGKTLDSKHTPRFAKYANDAHLSLFKNNAKIALNDKNQVCLIATKNIAQYTEILTSYGKAYWLAQSIVNNQK